MVIEVVIFFIWVILFLIMGAGVAFSQRRKEGKMTRKAWRIFFLCLAIAIVGPVVFHWVRNAAYAEAHKESLEQKRVNGGTGPSSPSGGAIPPGDSARPGSVVTGATPVNNSAVKTDSGRRTNTIGIPKAPGPNNTALKDTTYHVATPPQH